MNTYDVTVKGIKIFENISQEELQKNLIQVRGLVWTSGGSDQDIEVVAINEVR